MYSKFPKIFEHFISIPFWPKFCFSVTKKLKYIHLYQVGIVYACMHLYSFAFRDPSRNPVCL